MDWQPIETADDSKEPIIVWNKTRGAHVGRRCYGKEYRVGQRFYMKPTHWMPLPPPPARGTETRSAETTGLGPQDDGPVRKDASEGGQA